MNNMNGALNFDENATENEVISLPSDSGLSVNAIVFNSCSIKPNPFLAKNNSKINRI